MAAKLHVYRTYRYTDKNPVIDKVRTVLQDEGMYNKNRRNLLHQLSGVATATFDGWFEGETRNPRHETIMATLSSLGYEEQFVKTNELDIDKELAAAAKWFLKQNPDKKGVKRMAAKKTNGQGVVRPGRGK